MTIEFICDACGKRELGFATRMGEWHKPVKWYQRTTEAHIGEEPITQVACSRKCIEKLGGFVASW